MIDGKTLPDLARHVEQEQDRKADYLVDTRGLSLDSNGSSVLTLQELDQAYPVGKIAHGQLAERLGIPRRYYDRLRGDHPDLLDGNVNYLFQHAPERRLVRTLDAAGDQDRVARAYLSDRYRPLDNADLLEAVVPVLGEAESMEVCSCEVTERRLYLQVRFPHLEADDPTGSKLNAGLIVRNSEVGLGTLEVAPLVYRWACSNGLISGEYGQRRVHLGGGDRGDGASARQVYRDETLAADDRALWLKLQDTVRAGLSDPVFQQLVAKIEEAATDSITAPPQQAVEAVSAKLQLNDQERDGVLAHLASGGDMSRWGMVNAVTQLANDHADYDRAVELEQLGGKVLTLPRNEWARMANAQDN